MVGRVIVMDQGVGDLNKKGGGMGEGGWGRGEGVKSRKRKEVRELGVI